MGYVKYRRVKNDFGEDVVVHVDYEEHRLVTINLEDDVVDHVDYPDHRLVTTDLGEDVVVHVDYAEHRLVMINLHIKSISWYALISLDDCFYLSLGISAQSFL